MGSPLHKISVHKSALVPYPAPAMYALVADVDSYPSFLPWCRGASVRARSDGIVEASLEVARGPIRQRFSTRNTMHPHEAIELRLLDGPFRRLEGHWHFVALGENGCRVSLDLEFEFSSAVLRHLLGPVFREMANSLLSAFCRRARDLYDGAD